MPTKTYISKSQNRDVLFNRLTGPLDKSTPPACVPFRNHVARVSDPKLQEELEEHEFFGTKFWLSEGQAEESKIKQVVGTQYSDGPMTTASTKGATTGASIVNPPASAKKAKKAKK